MKTAPGDELTLIHGLLDAGNYAEARLRAERLSTSGNIEADVLLAWMKHSGTGYPRNVDEAESMYLKAAARGSGRAMFYLGSLYGERKDLVRAFQWFERSASLDFVPAIYHLGRMYKYGLGVRRNEDRARKCFETAAKHGHLFARRNIAHEMLRGQRGLARVPTGFIKLLQILWAVARTGWNNPDSDLLLRLK